MSQGEYFDRQAAGYHHGRAGMAPFHRMIAETMERELRGRVLCVGGLWNQARTGDYQVAVVDASRAMLRAMPDCGQQSIVGDALRLPFQRGTFDHVVLPLILHHIAGGSGSEAQAGARSAIAQAFDVLRAGGRIWISEFCPPPAVYALELVAAPATRLALSVLRTPLVIMHSRSFYLDALRGAGFVDERAETFQPPGAKPTDLITPIIGVPFIKVPRALYPVTPTLITARVADVR